MFMVIYANMLGQTLRRSLNGRDSYETFSLNSPTRREKSLGCSGNGEKTHLKHRKGKKLESTGYYMQNSLPITNFLFSKELQQILMDDNFTSIRCFEYLLNGEWKFYFNRRNTIEILLVSSTKRCTNSLLLRVMSFHVSYCTTILFAIS